MLWLALALTPAPACAAGVDATFGVDLRYVAADARPSFLGGGLGKLRFDEDHDGLVPGRVWLSGRAALGETWHATLEASAWSTDDTNPVDLTEAFVEWRPYPGSRWRSRVKAGAFYPPVSLEHRARGWTNPYTLSSSAINTWVGEELRTLGVEYRVDHVAQAGPDGLEFGFVGAVYGWNDPAGVVVAFRGFALHDRQTPLFGRIGTLPLNGPVQRELFAEIDDRPGYYAGAYARVASRTELRAFHYDNRADPAAFDARIGDYAWDTRFDAVGARFEGSRGLTVITQWLGGRTDVGPGGHDRWRFTGAFVLLSQQLGRHRLAIRAERFRSEQLVGIFGNELGRERGEALTLAWHYEPAERLELTTEWLAVDSTHNWRARLGEAPRARESALQLGVRYSFGTTP